MVSPKARNRYRAALMEIDLAMIKIGEALREDLEADREALKIIYEELSDAKRRLSSLVGGR